MKRFVLMVVSLLMVFSMAACDKKDGLDIDAAASDIIENYSLSGGTLYSSSKEDAEKLDAELIRSYYSVLGEVPDFDSVEAYVVYIDETKPLDPCEFGIFKMKDGADEEQFIMFLKARLNNKIESSKAYPTMDTSALKSAKFESKGGYIWYCAVKGGNDEINGELKGRI